MRASSNLALGTRRKGGRAVDGTCLRGRRGESLRGFESPSLELRIISESLTRGIMHTHFKDHKFYEDRYDNITLAQCRSGERLVNGTFKELEKKLPEKELKEKLPGWYLRYSQLYFLTVESVAAARAEARDQVITQWMAEDQEKDDKLSRAQLSGGGQYCKTCGKDLEVISKDYMHRDGHKDDDILIMFECEDCHKRTAFWQDGTEWEGAKHVCAKCGGNTISKHTKTKNKITWTETCQKCGHIETDSIGLSEKPTKKPEEIDLFLELDRKRFIFGSDMMFKYGQKLKHFQRMAKLGERIEDKVEHVDIYDAIKEVKKLKIAQLKELLEPIFIKNGYSDFKLGDPKIGREVSLDFSCLDTKDDREEYQSKKTLHKAIEKVLAETNWRLMSAGVSYRLGYLTGSLRAYESEDDLKKLVEQRMKRGDIPVTRSKKVAPSDDKPRKMDNAEIRESAQIYFDKLTLDSVPAEITLKSGKVKPTTLPLLRGDMHPNLKVIIPMRDNDESVPDFIRNYDFTFGDDERIPKVQTDKLGRTIRRA